MEGKVPCSVCYRGVAGMWVGYSDSSYFFDHFSYINYFHPSYGLFYMIFQSLNHFLEFLEFNLISKIHMKMLGAPGAVHPAVHTEADSGAQLTA